MLPSRGQGGGEPPIRSALGDSGDGPEWRGPLCPMGPEGPGMSPAGLLIRYLPGVDSARPSVTPDGQCIDQGLASGRSLACEQGVSTA